MAPIATYSSTETEAYQPRAKLTLYGCPPTAKGAAPGRNRLNGPLKYTGSLDHFPHFEVTPSIGREFGNELQLSDLLSAPNSDELIRDLGVLSA